MVFQIAQSIFIITFSLCFNFFALKIFHNSHLKDTSSDKLQINIRITIEEHITHKIYSPEFFLNFSLLTID